MEQFTISDDCNFSGVYAILNLDNHKIYIGSSRNIKNRLIGHKSKLTHHKNPIPELQQDFDRGDRFIGYVIVKVRLREEEYFTDDDLRYFEQKAINQFDSMNPEKGYNRKDSNKYYDLYEERRIKDAQQDLKYYFYMCNSSYSKREEEEEEFINKVLCKKGQGKDGFYRQASGI